MHIFTTNHKITARITLYTYYARMNRDALSIVNFFRTFLCEYTPINYEWCVVSFYVHLINSDFKYTKACVGIFAFFDFFYSFTAVPLQHSPIFNSIVLIFSIVSAFIFFISHYSITVASIRTAIDVIRSPTTWIFICGCSFGDIKRKLIEIT